jgi:hypothetical protein
MTEKNNDSQSDRVKEDGQTTEQQTPTPIREWIHISPFPMELLKRKTDESKK